MMKAPELLERTFPMMLIWEKCKSVHEDQLAGIHGKVLGFPSRGVKPLQAGVMSNPINRMRLSLQ